MVSMQAYLPDIKRLAAAGNVEYVRHGVERMYERGVNRKDVLHILTSKTNEIIERQVPTTRSPNERYLVYDPKYKDVIVVLSPIFDKNPMLRIITVENVDSSIWRRTGNAPPTIERIK